MKSKKIRSRKPKMTTISHENDVPQSKSESSVDIEKMFNKVMKSDVLNGGFNALMAEISEIKLAQNEIASAVDKNTSLTEQQSKQTNELDGKVEKITEAIYDPDNGLFARIKDVNSTFSTQINDTEVSLNKRLDVHSNSITTINKWKKNISSIAKWIVITIAGAGIPLIIKALWDTFAQ